VTDWKKMKNKISEPFKRLLSRSEVAERLGAQVLRDAIAAGWISPRAIKPGRTDYKASKIIFVLEDVLSVEDRIAAGQYPNSGASD
jgi:hypothetical protein